MSAILVVYILIILAIAYGYRATGRSGEGYLFADRKLGRPLSTLGLLGSFVGGGTLLAFVGHVAANGLSDIWFLLSASLSFVVLGWIAPELRNSNVRTLPEFVGQRFGKNCKWLLVPFSILALCGFLGVQIGAGSIVIAEVLDWHKYAVIVFMMVFVTTYTWLGGMKADTVSDAIQFVVVIAGMIVAAVILSREPSHSEFVGIPLSELNEGRFMSLLGGSVLETVGAAFVVPFMIISSPTYHQRIYSTAGSGVARQAAVWTAIAYIGVIVLIMLIGISGRRVLGNLDNYDSVLPIVMEQHVGSFVGAIVLAALVAAIMSSVDTHLLTLSALVCTHIFRQPADETGKTTSGFLARTVVVLGAVVGVGLAMLAGSLFTLLAGTWVVLGGFAAGPVIWAAKAPARLRISSAGILAGSVVGGGSSIIALVAGVEPLRWALAAGVLSLGVPVVVGWFYAGTQETSES